MEPIRFKVGGKHRIDLDCVKVEPKKDPKAIVQIFHGMGEHKERYLPFMTYLAEQGYAVYAHDHRKHGQSVIDETQVGIFDRNDRWDDVLDDCYFVTRKIHKDHPGKKLVIFGHSMGSIIARGYLSRNPLAAKAAILSGTLPRYTTFGAMLPRLLAGVVGLFSSKRKPNAFLAEQLNKPLLKDLESPRTKFDWLTRDEAVVDAYIKDPLCGYAYTPMFYREFFRSIVAINKSDFILLTKDIPILFISGSADPVGGNGDGVEELYRTYGGHGFTQLTLKLIDGARHEVLNEIDKQQTFDYIKNWLDQAIL